MAVYTSPLLLHFNPSVMPILFSYLFNELVVTQKGGIHRCWQLMKMIVTTAFMLRTTTNHFTRYSPPQVSLLLSFFLSFVSLHCPFLLLLSLSFLLFFHSHILFSFIPSCLIKTRFEKKAKDCIVQWLTRSPDTREIPSSSLGIVIFLFSSIPQSPSFCHAGCYVHARSVFALRRLRYALHAAARLPGRLEYRSLSSFIVDMRSMFSIFAYYFSQAIVGFSCIEFGDAGYLLLTYFTLGRRSPFSLTLRKRTLS